MSSRGCVHDLLTERAAADGAAMAISDGATTLTYGALESTADRVAQVLLELGVGVEDRVGVMLSASVDALVSIMAVLKVGAAYVPVDPEHPTSRLRWMADDSQLTALIGPSARAREIISPTTPVLDLERDAVRVTTASPLDFRPAVSPDNLAYVIYTSGTTGRPKGVAVEHRSVVAFASALDRRLRNVLPAGARVALNASLSFDASVQQWTRLLFGDTLVPIPRDLRLETAEWVAFLRDHCVSLVDCTPSQLKAVADTVGVDALPSHLSLLIGGEPLPSDLWETLLANGVSAFNAYGPTEATVDVLVESLHELGATPALGGQLGHAVIRVLDENLNPTLAGESGEIHVAGPALARGYLSRPGLTAGRFVPDPIGGGRLYRTGDIATQRSDGSLVFEGRRDRQVKVGGVRIELDELEQVLHGHPSVRQAAVSVHGHDANRVLVARVQPKRSGVSSADIRVWLSGRLPGAMVPARIELVDDMPLTVSGKLDRALTVGPPPPPPTHDHNDQREDEPMADTPSHRVVINEEEQYSIIAQSWPVPAGWREVGFEGSEEACMAHVDEVWTDMRPPSLRERLESV